MPIVAGTPEARQRARVAAYAQHADGRTNTAPARKALADSFRQQVLDRAAERGEQLTEREIERRTDSTRKLYYTRLAFESLKARKARMRKRPPAEAGVDQR